MSFTDSNPKPVEYRSSGETGSGIDPSFFDGSVSEPEFGPGGRRRRSDAGQPRGPRGPNSRTAGKKIEGNSLDLSAASGLLVGIFAMLSMQTQAPEWEIAKPEIDDFLLHVKNYSRHFSVKTTQKSLDLALLTFSGVTVFGTRGIATVNRLRREREGEKRPSATVSPLRAVPQPVANIQPDLSQIVNVGEGFDDAG
jgi:hypothetical protein